MATKKPGLYANIAAKKARIKAGSNEKMRKPGQKGRPTAKNFKNAAKTVKKKWEIEMASDVQATYLTASGAVFGGRARIKAIHYLRSRRRNAV